MVSHRSLSAIKFSQVSRTLLSILADVNDSLLWIVSTWIFIPKSFSPFNKPLGIVPSAICTIVIIVIFIFHIFLHLEHGHFAFFYFCSGVCQNDKVSYLAGSLFYCWLLLGLVVWPRFGNLFVSQNSRELCAFHSPRRILSFAYITYSDGWIKFFQDYYYYYYYYYYFTLLKVFFLHPR